jgi:hypothetical protein
LTMDKSDNAPLRALLAVSMINTTTAQSENIIL